MSVAEMAACVLVAGAICPSHTTNAGSRIPPSHVEPLPTFQ
jgi:hypothetical protein